MSEPDSGKFFQVGHNIALNNNKHSATTNKKSQHQQTKK